MSTRPPYILVTNDDGPDSFGLRAAIEVAQTLGEVLVVCPRVNQTCMSRAFLRGPDIGNVSPHNFHLSEGMVKGYTIAGAPSQVISIALLELVSKPPDLCISGINAGENLGYTVHLSGTIAAAAQAGSHGVPSMAVSMEEDDSHFGKTFDPEVWKPAMTVTSQLARLALRGLNPNVSCLNINIPSCVEMRTEWRLCEQSRLDPYRLQLKNSSAKTSSDRYTFASNYTSDQIASGSDLDVFWRRREVSVTPIAHELTVRDAKGRPCNPFNET